MVGRGKPQKFSEDRRFLGRGSNAGSLSTKDENNHDNYQ
jgi:hypothetical protein